MIKSFVISVSLIAVSLLQFCWAEEATRLREIMVTGTKEKPPATTLISDERLEDWKTADALFENVAGVDLRRTSLGSPRSEVLIRGFDTSRNLIMLNGRPLNGAGVYGGYYVDWSTLPLGDIEKVELVRGAGSALYGNSIGGIINIITKCGGERRRTSLQLSAGSHNTQVYRFNHSWKIGRLAYSISVGHTRSDGYLRNNFTRTGNLTLELSYLMPTNGRITLFGKYLRGKVGFIVNNRRSINPESPDYAVPLDPSYPPHDGNPFGGPYLPFKGERYYWGGGSFWWKWRKQFDLTISQPLGRTDIEARAYLNGEDRDEYLYAVDDPDKLVIERRSKPDRSWGWSLKARSTRFEDHLLDFGLEGRRIGYGGIEVERFDPEYFRWPPTSGGGKGKPTRMLSAFAQDRWRFSERFSLLAGLRFDDYRSESGNGKKTWEVSEKAVSPKFTLSAKTGPIKGYLSVNRFCRFPTEPEVYWWGAGYQPPDRSELKPETGTQYEVGVSKSLGSWDARLAAYRYDVKDYIRTIFGYKPSRVVYNIEGVKIQGMEIETNFKLPLKLSGYLNYTYQRTKKEGDILDMSNKLTDELVDLPHHRINAGLKYSLAEEAYLGLSVRYVGKRYAITGNLAKPNASALREMKGFLMLNAGLRYPLPAPGGLKPIISASVENLLDESYEETYGFPMPGRTFHIGLKMEF